MRKRNQLDLSFRDIEHDLLIERIYSRSYRRLLSLKNKNRFLAKRSYFLSINDNLYSNCIRSQTALGKSDLKRFRRLVNARIRGFDETCFFIIFNYHHMSSDKFYYLFIGKFGAKIVL